MFRVGNRVIYSEDGSIGKVVSVRAHSHYPVLVRFRARLNLHWRGFFTIDGKGSTNSGNSITKLNLIKTRYNSLKES